MERKNYIRKIYSERDITKDFTKQFGHPPNSDVVQADIEVEYGNIRKRIGRMFSAEAWREIKRQGYFIE